MTPDDIAALVVRVVRERATLAAENAELRAALAEANRDLELWHQWARDAARARDTR